MLSTMGSKDKGKKWDKPPVNPRTGHLCDGTKSDKGFTVAEVMAGFEAGRCDGVGIILGPIPGTDLVLSGLDLEDVLNPFGEPNSWARWILTLLASYSEV